MNEEQIRIAVNEAMTQVAMGLQGEFMDLRAFVDRRLSDLVVDLTHTFEHVDDTETRIAQRLDASETLVRSVMSDVVERLSMVTESVGGDSTASSGAELELAVRATEESADKILTAAERLSSHAAELSKRDDPDSKRLAQAIADDVAVIFEASSFHDLAGQRVRGAIRILEEVRTAIAESAGLPKPATRHAGPAPASMGGDAVNQADIDKLFD